MNDRSNRPGRNEIEAQVIFNDSRMEIELDGPALLSLPCGRPGMQVKCSSGTLWLTQESDPQDHFIKAGQIFTLYTPGMVLVQGLPHGKALILDIADEPIYQYNQVSGGRRWTTYSSRCAP